MLFPLPLSALSFVLLCQFIARQERDNLMRLATKAQSDHDPGFKRALAELEKNLTANGVKVTEK